MKIFGTRLHASNDFIVKLWASAAVVILAVATFLTWSDRFRESFETSISKISVFGIETSHGESANFTGSRGFFAKMNKLGLPASTRKTELSALFEELKTSGALDAKTSAVPVLWIYAEGLTKAVRDRGVQTFGNVFFEKNRFCFSIADANGFSIQLDPDTFRVLWAKDGGAICALPLLLLPNDAATHGFSFKIEERGNDGSWIFRGETKIFPRPEFLAKTSTTDNFSTEEKSTNASEPFPRAVSVEKFSTPKICRFFSAPLFEKNAFGELVLKIEGDAEGRVPAAAWTLVNVGISAGQSQSFPASRADAFHKNVRFLEREIFEESDDGILRVPVAKSLFPSTEPLNFDLIFARRTYFPEDFHTISEIRIGKNSSVIANPYSAKNSTVKIRAFRDTEYFRALNKRAAIVLEIENGTHAQPSADFFWEPYRVSTNAGEELFPESIVEVSPNVRQYWFLPRIPDSKKNSGNATTPANATLDVVFAVTKIFRTKCTLSNENTAGTPAENR